MLGPGDIGFLWMLVWGAFVVLGCYVSVQKGREFGEGFMLSLLFGPFGVLIAALLPTKLAANYPPAVLPSPQTMAFMPKSNAASRPRPSTAPMPPPLPAKERAYVVSEDGIVRWTCECGNYRTAPAATHGMPNICPRCSQVGTVPGSGAPTVPMPASPKPRAQQPPAPARAPTAPRPSFEDEDGINDGKALEFLAEMEQRQPRTKRRS